MRRISFTLLLGIVLCSGCSGPRVKVLDAPGRKGTQRPYTVDGKLYVPMESHEGFVQEGMASWYGKEEHGGPTSSGETFDMNAMTAAHKTLPLGVWVRARNRENGREVEVRINDRGPFVKERIIDFSAAAARRLGMTGRGTAPVRIEALGYRESSGSGTSSYRPPASYDAGAYAVQVAAFTVSANARRLADEMARRHGAAAVQEGTVNGSRFYRVRVGRYGSLQKAEEARGDFERHGYRGSFVVALD